MHIEIKTIVLKITVTRHKLSNILIFLGAVPNVLCIKNKTKKSIDNKII
ncbi:hypothetical protein [Clostridium baratii]|nr:hypothetical protein [Clostridium baratii]